MIYKPGQVPKRNLYNIWGTNWRTNQAKKEIARMKGMKRKAWGNLSNNLSKVEPAYWVHRVRHDLEDYFD